MMPPNKVTYEITLACSSAKAMRVARRLMESHGIPPAMLAEADEQGKLRLSCYTSSKKEALALRRQLSLRSEKGMTIALKSLKNIDWLTKWKKDFKPFLLTNDIRVVPAWLKSQVKTLKSTKDIYISSTMAFGTGMHPTTRAVAGFLEQEKRRYASFLDVGAGTGILGLIAAAYGATAIAGVDICPDAVTTARKNFRLNRCPYVFLEIMDLRKHALRRSFDFVAANILGPTLIVMRDNLVSCVRPGGFLAVSGIWRDGYGSFSRCYAIPVLQRIRVQKEDGWVSVLFRKTG